MDLGTFGAILGFAMQLEDGLITLFQEESGGNADLRHGMARAAEKRRKRLERARREGVAEMILEPITGLQSETYEPAAGGEGESWLRRALEAEDAAARFYHDAGGKLPIREVSRLLLSFSEECEAHVATLREQAAQEAP
jgi:rubrerythrin